MPRISGILNRLPIARRVYRIGKRLLANRNDVRLWFTGVDAAFEGHHLQNYPGDYTSRIQSPWPQPSPHDPQGLAPTVLHVPVVEIEEFLDTVVARYLRTLKREWPLALLESWQNPGLEPVSLAEFTRMLTESSFSRFLNPQLDEVDRGIFAAWIARRPKARLFKVDLGALALAETLPGLKLHPSVTLLERHEDGRFEPLVIRLAGICHEPGDGESWLAAQYFVLNGCANLLVISAHPRVHFPFDTINAVTKTILPQDHPLARLLLPHCYLQLPLNFAVLYIDRSVAHNHQTEIYTPFAVTRKGFIALMKAGYSGIPGNSSYPRYHYQAGGMKVHSPYGQFLARYYEVFERFAARVLASVKADDEAVIRWADAIAAQLPGFPSSKEIFESVGEGKSSHLIAAAATFMHNCSVVHSADHHLYARESIRQIPLRLRAEPPRARHSRVSKRAGWLRRSDHFRHFMANRMYFKTNTLRALTAVRYGLESGSELVAEAVFFDELRELDRDPEMCRFVPLKEIACSIQY